MLNEAEPNQKGGGGFAFFLTFNLNDDDALVFTNTKK